MELNSSRQFVRNKMAAVKTIIFQVFNDNIELNECYQYSTSLINGLSWWIFNTFKHCKCVQVFIGFVFN